LTAPMRVTMVSTVVTPRQTLAEAEAAYLLTAPMRVTMVSTVVTPRPTLAGAEAAYLLTAPMRVTKVSTVVTPRPTLAGAEAMSIQKCIPVDSSHEGDHGEYSGDPEANPGRGRGSVKPEADP
jgi:hypothetical protein